MAWGSEYESDKNFQVHSQYYENIQFQINPIFHPFHTNYISRNDLYKKHTDKMDSSSTSHFQIRHKTTLLTVNAMNFHSIATHTYVHPKHYVFHSIPAIVFQVPLCSWFQMPQATGVHGVWGLSCERDLYFLPPPLPS